MTAPAIFPYLPMNRGAYPTTPTPILPFQLEYKTIAIPAEGYLDTGAMISVLPYSIGLLFGADWNALPPALTLAGALVSTPAKLLTITATIGHFPPTMLIFAWARTDACPLLLGYLNFFLEFDVAFYATRGIFTVEPRTP